MMLARHNLAKEDYGIRDPADTVLDENTQEITKSNMSRPQASRTHSANSVLRSARKQHFRKETGGDIPKRRIHFNESVEQCISIIKNDPEDDEYDSVSSEDAPTMRISAPRPPSNIAKLPSTTLKLPSPTSVQQSPGQFSQISSIYSDNHDHNSAYDHSPANSGSTTVRSSRSNSTESAILPNYDGIQDSSPPPGIFGRAAEVVYSARDLVSVMWSSSGWRRNDNTS